MRSVFSTLLQRSIQDCFRLIESNSPGYIRKPLDLVECFCIEPARPAVSAQMGRPSNLVNPQDSRCKKKPTVQVQAKKTNPAPRQRVHRNVNLQRAMRFMGLTESGVVQIDDSDGESVPSIASDLHMHAYGRNTTPHCDIAKCLACGDLYGSPQCQGFVCMMCQGRRFSQHKSEPE